MWHYREAGSGRPLILLHGIGMSHAAWHPVVPLLSLTRRVIAFDIAGFGATPPLPSDLRPTIGTLVSHLGQSLRELGLAGPVDIAGNSLGGTMALEAARQGLARSAVAISPPGLWTEGPAAHVRYVFGGLRLITRYAPRLLKAGLRFAACRELALAIPLSRGSARMPAADAHRAIDDLAGSTAFEATFLSTCEPFSGTDIAVRVTVVFGSVDWILTGSSRHRHCLPAQTTWLTKRGWGHVPMWVDPVAVSQVILEGTS